MHIMVCVFICLFVFFMLDFSQTGAIDRSQDIMMQIDNTTQRDWGSLYTPANLVSLHHPDQVQMLCHRVAEFDPFLVWI